MHTSIVGYNRRPQYRHRGLFYKANHGLHHLIMVYQYGKAQRDSL